VDSCATGRIKWTASRSPGRIYGGTTSQDRPVVVRLDHAAQTLSCDTGPVRWKAASG